MKSPFGRGITLHRELTNHGYWPLTKWDDPPSIDPCFSGDFWWIRSHGMKITMKNYHLLKQIKVDFRMLRSWGFTPLWEFPPRAKTNLPHFVWEKHHSTASQISIYNPQDHQEKTREKLQLEPICWLNNILKQCCWNTSWKPRNELPWRFFPSSWTNQHQTKIIKHILGCQSRLIGWHELFVIPSGVVDLT